MPDVVGARHTLGITQGMRAIDMRAAILELEPSAAPLTVLASRIPAKPTIQTDYKWTESELEARFDAINATAGYDNAATSVVVDNGGKFAIADLVKVTRTGEVMRVTGVSTNTLTVRRGIGNTAAAIVDNDELLKIASAEAEGSDVKPARSSNPTIVTNYTQIIRDSFSITRTLMETKSMNTPGEWEYAAAHAGIEHKKHWEYVFWLGEPSEFTNSDGKAERTTGGALHFISSNVTDVGGTMTESEFFGGFRAPMRYGSKVRTAFASALAIDVLNGYPKGKLEVVQGDSTSPTYGLNVTRYVSGNGTLNVVEHPLFEGAVYGGYIAVLDLSQIRRRPLHDTTIERDRGGNGVDGKTDEYLTEQGLEFGLEQRHALYVGITG